ncbi:MAG: hypothetical protein LBL94_03705 [Prevotellaceae bacterium]|jgi:hypothetical protein|nr:hypothetical protein [Prevotellaceae bacterium]
MKPVNFVKITFAALALLGLGGAVTVNAQTATEKKLKDLKARRELAKETVRDGNLNTLEREANVGEDPCTLYDDNEWYAAFNQKEGRRGDPKLANTLLASCKQQLSQKIEGAYRAVQRDYFDAMDINEKSAAVAHFEGAGEMVVEKMLKETRETCRKTSNPDEERGNIIMHMSIKISKKEIVDKVVKELSQDKQLQQQLGVRFSEEKFRESALKRFEMDKEEE